MSAYLLLWSAVVGQHERRWRSLQELQELAQAVGLLALGRLLHAADDDGPDLKIGRAHV